MKQQQVTVKFSTPRYRALGYYLEKEGKNIESELQNSLITEIKSADIGEMVLDRLRDVDIVSYIRFASVYREFKDVGTFLDELSRFISDADKGKGEKK